MLIGVLSDTHGKAKRARAAVRLLEKVGAAALVHCGDVGSEAVLDELAGRPTSFIWGNTDEDTDGLAAHARSLGLDPPGRCPRVLHLAGRTIHVYHGHEPEFARLLRRLEQSAAASAPAAADAPDVVLYGHTHVADQRRLGSVLLVNPGALHRAARYSVATIDLRELAVMFWPLDEADAEQPKPIDLREI